jgi:hypothetical protein
MEKAVFSGSAVFSVRTYLYDVAYVDDDAAVDGLHRDPVAVVEYLEPPDVILDDEGDAVAVLVRADAVEPGGRPMHSFTTSWMSSPSSVNLA